MDLLHLRGFKQESGYAQSNGLLRIAEVPVSGQHRHLQIRKLRTQSGEHSQAVLPGHTDVCEQDLRLQAPNKLRSAPGIPGAPDHFAVPVLPVDHFCQAFQNQSLIVYQHNSVHRRSPLRLSVLILAFNRPCRQALDNVLLQADRDDKHRDYHQYHGCRHQAVVDAGL